VGVADAAALASGGGPGTSSEVVPGFVEVEVAVPA